MSINVLNISSSVIKPCYCSIKKGKCQHKMRINQIKTQESGRSGGLSSEEQKIFYYKREKMSSIPLFISYIF